MNPAAAGPIIIPRLRQVEIIPKLTPSLSGLVTSGSRAKIGVGTMACTTPIQSINNSIQLVAVGTSIIRPVRPRLPMVMMVRLRPILSIT